jgi:hypothetical protein
VLHGKYGFRLSRDMYAIPNPKPSVVGARDWYTDAQWERSAWAFEDDDHTRYSEEFLAQQQRQALQNFDLNMAFFASIPQQDFDDAVAVMLRKNRALKPVTHLPSLDDVQGVYVLVLDEYRQAYIGQAWNLRRRIRQHWTGTKSFDRLLWGSVEESVMSIDSFRALDTTRIFAARTFDAFELEQKLERAFPGDYLLNRIHGGEMNGIRSKFITTEMKRRKLVADDAPAVTVDEPAREDTAVG